MFELIENVPSNAVIKVIGVGGGGGNAVKAHDREQRRRAWISSAPTPTPRRWPTSIQNRAATWWRYHQGARAGANPEIGRAAAMEDRDRIADAPRCRYGVHHRRHGWRHWHRRCSGGCRDRSRNGILTVAVVTRPFPFEGKKRPESPLRVGWRIAAARGLVDHHSQRKLLEVLGKNTSLLDAFKEANDVLLGAVQGHCGPDYPSRNDQCRFRGCAHRHVRNGYGDDGYRQRQGENRAREAAERAINSPLLDDINLEGARGILVNITAGLDLSWASSPKSVTRLRNLRQKMRPSWWVL